MKLLVVFFFLIFFFGCINGELDEKENLDCQKLFTESKLNVLDVEQYKEAIWQIYKFNLIQTDSFQIPNSFPRDSINETSLSEFNMVLENVRNQDDTLSYALYFEKGVSPNNKTYYVGISFWEESEMIYLHFDRFESLRNLNEYENEFKEYIARNRNNISPMLECLAKERGVNLK